MPIKYILFFLLVITTNVEGAYIISSFPHTQDCNTNDATFQSEFVVGALNNDRGQGTYQATDGWQGSGCYRMTPDVDEGLWEGLLTGMDRHDFPKSGGNGPQSVNMRFLVYYGTDYVAGIYTGSEHKVAIFRRCNAANCDSTGDSSARGNLMEDDDAVGGKRGLDTNDNIGLSSGKDSNNGSKPDFFIDDYLGEWISMEVEWDLINGEYTLWIATQDRVHTSDNENDYYSKLTGLNPAWSSATSYVFADANPTHVSHTPTGTNTAMWRLLADNTDIEPWIDSGWESYWSPTSIYWHHVSGLYFSYCESFEPYTTASGLTDVYVQIDELAFDNSYIGPPGSFGVVDVGTSTASFNSFTGTFK